MHSNARYCFCSWFFFIQFQLRHIDVEPNCCSNLDEWFWNSTGINPRRDLWANCTFLFQYRAALISCKQKAQPIAKIMSENVSVDWADGTVNDLVDSQTQMTETQEMRCNSCQSAEIRVAWEQCLEIKVARPKWFGSMGSVHRNGALFRKLLTTKPLSFYRAHFLLGISFSLPINQLPVIMILLLYT